MAGFRLISDERTVYRILARPGTIVLPADACNGIAGFVADTFTEYRNRSVYRESLHRRSQEPSALTWHNPFRGSSHLAIAMQDSAAGAEPFELWLGCRKLADGVAEANDNRVHLLILEQPLDLKQGEVFAFRTGANGLPYRVESFALLRRLPAAVARRAAVGELALPRAKPHRAARLHRVGLSVEGRPGLRAKAFPLTTGVPLPAGVLSEPRRAELRDAVGRLLPLQTRGLSHWPDGSIAWLLLDFQAAVGTAEQALELCCGTGVTELPDGPSLATAMGDGVRIETGALQVELGLGLPLPIGRVWRAGEHLTGGWGEAGVLLRAANGRVFRSAGGIEAVQIEENGPLRAVVRLDCRHRDDTGDTLFRSLVRVHAYAGKSWLRIDHTFLNDRPEEPFTHVRELLLQTPFGGPPAGRRRMAHELDDRCRVYEHGRLVSESGRGSGRLSGPCASGVAAVAVRDFQRNYPKAIALGEDGVTVEILPDLAGQRHGLSGLDEERRFWYLDGETYKLKHGLARTHSLFYGFGPAGGGAQLERQARAFQDPPLVRVAPEACLASGAVGELAAKSEGEPYERWLGKALVDYLADQRKQRADGLFNWGDWFGERRYNWGNMEYDTPWVFLCEYLRGGDRRFAELGLAATWHLADVDTCHASPHAHQVGGQWLHCIAHVGGYYPDGWREEAISSGHQAPSHTWVEGLFLAWSLTGEERLREVALATCDKLAASVEPHSYDFDNCREPGWLLIHLCAAWRATLERRYAEAAQVVVARILERQRESGGWERLMVPGHCFCDPPRHKGNAAFMVGVMLAGLRRWHQITGDRQVAACLVRGAEYVVDCHWVPELRVFRYTNCPHIWAGVEMNPQMLEGLAYAWRLSRSERLGEVVRASFERCFEPRPEDRWLTVRVPGYPETVFDVADEGVGKEVSLWMRQAPFALRDYRELPPS